jgi:hypothetical protein
MFTRAQWDSMKFQSAVWNGDPLPAADEEPPEGLLCTERYDCTCPGCWLKRLDGRLPPENLYATAQRLARIAELLESQIVRNGEPELLGKTRPPPPGSIVSEDRAARALPWRRKDVVAWLRREGLSKLVDGHRVVVWEDVAARLAEGTTQPAPQRRSRSAMATSSVTDPPPLAKPGRMLDP